MMHLAKTRDMRTTAARRLLRWPALALVLLTLLSAATPTSDAAPNRLRIATWNMCGVQQWNCQGTGSGRRKVQALKSLADVDGARVIMLQEVCAGDLAAARRELGANWVTAFRAYTYRNAKGQFTTVRCATRSQGRAGVAILASSPLSGVAVVPSQQPGLGLHRGILCATVLARDIRVCSAHLSLPGSDRAHPTWELRDDQLTSLVGAADSRTVFGGDLNSAPPTTGNGRGWIWPHETFRRYRECDQRTASSRTGRATLHSGGKVDYLFTELPRISCTVKPTSASDHLPLIMEVGTR
ncbi:endonuclease/exonuclease/phosphatase family protein [Streptomyces sp. NBC_01618]|uniref:endonuclease/exonuclease/phosphatase family protein n=1 Tax=Streptomyces sp. NBC_01618 TaxID=2975900 RepID=UPI0038664B49|nr:endonuclease/exonuclease/phosphatase family protein [Streptomyces sp. NBC_01618]